VSPNIFTIGSLFSKIYASKYYESFQVLFQVFLFCLPSKQDLVSDNLFSLAACRTSEHCFKVIALICMLLLFAFLATNNGCPFAPVSLETTEPSELKLNI
jgi:hypothetical protein